MYSLRLRDFLSNVITFVIILPGGLMTVFSIVVGLPDRPIVKYGSIFDSYSDLYIT